MRLNSIRLVNFRQHADTRIDFDLGLTGIIGPNGAGKTTILEAVAWALYGNPAARGTRDSIRYLRAGARQPVRVELDFELGGHRYRVQRGLTGAELYLDGAAQPIANSLMGVTEFLQRRLGMSREEFFHTYFTGQKELNVMAAMKPTERAHFLSRVLGYERLRTAQGLARDRRRVVRAEIDGLRAGMPNAEEVQRSLAVAEQGLAEAMQRRTAAEQLRRDTEARLVVLTPRHEEVQRERQRLTEARAALTVATAAAESLARDADRIARELAQVERARVEVERLQQELAPLAGLREALRGLDDQYREEGRRRTLLESVRALGDDLVRLRERHARIAQAPALEAEAAAALELRRKDLDVVTQTLEALRTEWVRDRQEAETKLQSLRDQWADVKERRDRLQAAGETGECPVCARPLGGHAHAVIEELAEQLETLRVDGAYFKARVEQLAEAPEDVRNLEERRKAVQAEVLQLERRLAKCQSASQELGSAEKELAAKEARLVALEKDVAAVPAGYDAQRHEQVRRDVRRLEPLEKELVRCEATVGRGRQLGVDAERVARERAAAERTVAQLTAQLDELRAAEPGYAEVERAYERASVDARAAELAAERARGDERTAGAAREAARKAQAELERVQGLLAGLQGEHRLHDELDRAYTEMREDLNHALRPEIAELASAFLQELTDARYSELELNEQYDFVLHEDGLPKPVISGGEEDLANLVLRLAISQMIAERAGQPFSLLILDEVFGSLDEGRRHNVVELLRRLHDRFEQVILITHVEGVREGLDRVITVRYDEERGVAMVAQGEPGEPAGAGGLDPLDDVAAD
ncbi:MAG: AAA family ATPase [Gemmatimonadaceae bacterium]